MIHSLHALIRTGANDHETALQHQVVRKLQQQQLQELQDLLTKTEQEYQQNFI